MSSTARSSRASRGTSRSADARYADRHDLEQSVQGPDAARGLDRDVERRVGAHELQVLVRGAAGREPGRRLDEVRAGVGAGAACADLLVVIEVRVLEDD